MPTHQPGPGLGRRRDPRLDTQLGHHTEALPTVAQTPPSRPAGTSTVTVIHDALGKLG